MHDKCTKRFTNLDKLDMVKFACGGGNTASAALKNDAHFNSGESNLKMIILLH